MNREYITSLTRLTSPNEIAASLDAAFDMELSTLPFVEWALGSSQISFQAPGLTDTDQLFIDAILGHKSFRSGERASSKITFSGQEFDVLGSRNLIDNWPISKILCFLSARKTKPTRRCAAVVGMRDEGVTAIEWIAHYKTIGVEKIFIYTNNNVDKSEKILELLANHDEVSLIHNFISSDINPQYKIYEHFIHILPESRDYVWCCFFDSDELFVPDVSLNFNINHLIDHVDSISPHVAAVWYPWRFVVSDRCFARTSELLAVRFQYAAKHTLVKSIAKIDGIISLEPLHSPYILTDRICLDAALKSQSLDQLFVPQDWSEDTGKLYHYWFKSFQEFYLKKMRGDSITLEHYRRDFGLFFSWNGSSETTPVCPMPPAMIDAVSIEISRLMSLEGVAEAASQSDIEFERLVAFDAQGRPLRQLYSELYWKDNRIMQTDLAGENYADTLRRIHETLLPKSYLEIGVFTGQSLALARCKSIAVDPLFRIDAQYLSAVLAKSETHFFSMSSDDFFDSHDPKSILDYPVDFAFLDGMHRCEYLLRDFINVEKACKPNSIIALHDCLPVDTGIVSRDPEAFRDVSEPHRSGWWAGDTWRTSLLLRRYRPDLKLTVLDSAPTGLILITNLDPSNTILSQNYVKYVDEMLSWDLAEIGVENLFEEMRVISTSEFQTTSQVSSRFWL